MCVPVNGRGVARSGGRWINSRGYVMVMAPGHPAAHASGYAPEHRLVFYNTYGRLPADGAHVHHRDGDKQNNAPENLEEQWGAEHGRLHLTPERAREIGRKGGRKLARMRRKLQRGTR